MITHITAKWFSSRKTPTFCHIFINILDSDYKETRVFINILDSGRIIFKFDYRYSKLVSNCFVNMS